MKTYTFKWDFDIESESIEDAIDQLKGVINDPDNTATCYTVRPDGKFTEGYIDILEEENHGMSEQLVQSIKKLEE